MRSPFSRWRWIALLSIYTGHPVHFSESSQWDSRNARNRSCFYSSLSLTMGNVLSHSSNDRSLFIRVGTISRFLPVSGFIVSFLHATLTTLQGACVSGNGDATATASGSTAPASGEVEAPLSYLVHLLGTTRRSGKPSDLDSVTILPDHAGSGYSFPVCVEHIFNSFADIGSLSWITHHIPHEIGLLDTS